MSDDPIEVSGWTSDPYKNKYYSYTKVGSFHSFPSPPLDQAAERLAALEVA